MRACMEVCMYVFNLLNIVFVKCDVIGNCSSLDNSCYAFQ